MTPKRQSQKYKNHDWKLGELPPIIRAHSLAKHRVIKTYLQRYVDVLTVNPAQDQLRLTLVDGFAGGGRYLHARTKEECSGSPVIMLEAMEVAKSVAQQKRKKPFNLDVDYFFIEKDPDAFEYLKDVLTKSKFRNLLTDKIRVHLVFAY